MTCKWWTAAVDAAAPPSLRRSRRSPHGAGERPNRLRASGRRSTVRAFERPSIDRNADPSQASTATRRPVRRAAVLYDVIAAPLSHLAAWAKQVKADDTRWKFDTDRYRQLLARVTFFDIALIADPERVPGWTNPVKLAENELIFVFNFLLFVLIALLYVHR